VDIDLAKIAVTATISSAIGTIVGTVTTDLIKALAKKVNHNKARTIVKWLKKNSWLIAPTAASVAAALLLATR